MTAAQERNLRALLDCAIGECRPINAFFQNMKKGRVEIAVRELESFGVRNTDYWNHTLIYMEEIGIWRPEKSGIVIIP